MGFDADPSYLKQVVWGIALVISAIGWGRGVSVISHLSKPGGMEAAWGIAATLAFCSILGLFPGPWVGFLLMGWIASGLFLFSWFHRSRPRGSGTFQETALFGVLFLLFGFQVLMHLGSPLLNAFDDGLAYLPMARKVLQTGDLIEPFSLRRAASFGGQSWLTALALPGFGPYGVSLLERAVFPALILLILLSPAFLGKSARIFWVAALVIISLHQYPIINLAAHTSGILLLLGLYGTHQILKASRESDWRKDLVLAGVAAGAASLRAHHVLFGGLFLVLSSVRLFREEKYRAFRPVLFYFMLLLPWASVLFLSSGTPFYPLLSGNVVQVPGSMDVFWDGYSLLNTLTKSGWLILFGLIWLDPGNRVFHGAGAIVGLMLCLLLSRFPTEELSRYLHPYLFLSSVLFLSRAWDERWVWSRTCLARGAAVLAVASYLLASLPYLGEWPAMARSAIREVRNPHPFRSDSTDRGRTLQAKIPGNLRVLAAMEEPWILDFKKNPIWILDVPGHAAPGGSFPSFESGAEVDRFLRSLDVDILVISKGESTSGPFSKELWLKQLERPASNYHQAWAERFLSFHRFAEAASKRLSVLYDDEKHVILSLPSGIAGGGRR